MFGLSYKEKIMKFLTKKNIFWGIVIFFFLFNFIQIHRTIGTFSRLKDNDTSLISEVGDMRQTYMNIGEDLNEVRQFLRLPTATYTNLDSPATLENSDKNNDMVQLALFKYIDYLAVNQRLSKRMNLNTGLLNQLSGSEKFIAFLKQGGLTLSDIKKTAEAWELQVIDENEKLILTFYLDLIDAHLYRKTIKSKEKLSPLSFNSFYDQTVKFLSENKVSLQEYLADVAEIESKIVTVLTHDLVINKMKSLNISIDENWRIFNQNGEIIGEILLDKASLVVSLIDLTNNSNSKNTEKFGADILAFIDRLDTQTLVEKKAYDSLKSMKKTLNDPGFQLLLDDNGLYISDDVREDDERMYFDIYNMNDVHVSSLVVEKTTGVINIVQPDGTNSENILFFDPEFKKKTLEIPEYIPNYNNSETENGTFNILIAGKHGSLIDTMIFAHINEETQKIKMISIPRDLWYKGRKINALANLYGMLELKKVLSDITGYELDKYILIDMYAFIEVVDLIGGIDISLEKAVVDPTYRTIDNGVEGTLNYPPGDYHLGGKEALRLARTRHTSSDFARAERQQMILQALQSKARNFGFGDADTIYSIIKSVLEKTETDIKMDEALAYYFRYQNYEIVSNDVLSSANVLYVPPYITKENCNELMAQAEAAGEPDPGCANENHAYTLSPRNDNWKVIKWFFRETFDEV